MTGNPNVCLMSRSRATVSLPCNCKMSGCSASMRLASVASSASTVSATFDARPFARLPSSRAIPRLRCRGDGGKNTNPTMSAPASSATSSVSRVDRPQILTIRDMFQGTGWGGDARPEKSEAMGRVLQRRALLVSPAGPISAALLRGRKPLRIVPRGRNGARAQIGQLRPCLSRIGLVLSRRGPPVALPEPGRGATRHHARDLHRNDDDEQRQGYRDRRIGGIERVERYRHEMEIGRRQTDEDQTQRNQHQSREELAHDHLALLEIGSASGAGSSAVAVQPFTHFLARLEKRDALLIHRYMRAGARIAAGAAGRCFTENAPKPRSSTRSPRASA